MDKMWQGKHKAVTFSFDDGITQDKRLIEILNKYNLRSTFNLNSAVLGINAKLNSCGREVTHNKIDACEIKDVYYGHEIAGHSLTHPFLTDLDDNTVAYQVEKDREILSDLCGYEVIGFAYPYGKSDARIANILRNSTGVKYARTVTPASDFELQKDLLQFNPTVYYVDEKNLFDKAKEFLELPNEGNKLLYIWGHSYEMDSERIKWERFEEFCEYISKRLNIFYGTNKDIFDL